MGEHLTDWQKEDRRAYRDRVFPDKKEYRDYENLQSLINEILELHTHHDVNPKTYKTTKRLDISMLCFEMQRFLQNYLRLVDKVRQECTDPEDWKVYGNIDILKAMQDSPNFMSQYHQLQDVLTNRINGCNRETYPAESIMPDTEIMFVLHGNRGLIKKCKNPSYFVQSVAVGNAAWNIKQIQHPDEGIVERVCDPRRSRDGGITKILLVNPKYRPLRPEIEALIAGVLWLSQINKKRLIEHDYNEDGYWGEWILKGLAQKVEEQRNSLSAQELKQFRLNAVGWTDEDVRALQYMYHGQGKLTTYRDLNGLHTVNPSGPGEDVEKKAIQTYPDNISYIQRQYPDIQQFALFCAFRNECDNKRNIMRNNITLSSVYGQLERPNAQTREIYHDLKKLMDNFLTITELKYQNEQVQKGCLYLAYAKDLDVGYIYTLFKKPTDSVRELYETILKKQTEYKYTEVAKWNPFTKCFVKTL